MESTFEFENARRLIAVSFSKDINELSEEDQKIVDDLFTKRKAARESKDWATSDTLREQIKSFGVEVVD